MRIRTLHRWAALFLLPPLLVYFVSSVLLAHRSWWPAAPPQVSKTTVTIPWLNGGRDVASELMARGLVRGEIRQVVQSGGHLAMSIQNPAAKYSVTCEGESCEVLKMTNGIAGLLTSLHRTSGWNTWGAVLVIVSLGLLLLGLTGIWMVLANPRERRTNMVLLALSMSCALYLLISMRL